MSWRPCCVCQRHSQERGDQTPPPQASNVFIIPVFYPQDLSWGKHSSVSTTDSRLPRSTTVILSKSLCFYIAGEAINLFYRNHLRFKFEDISKEYIIIVNFFFLLLTFITLWLAVLIKKKKGSQIQPLRCQWRISSGSVFPLLVLTSLVYLFPQWDHLIPTGTSNLLQLPGGLFSGRA